MYEYGLHLIGSTFDFFDERYFSGLRFPTTHLSPKIKKITHKVNNCLSSINGVYNITCQYPSNPAWPYLHWSWRLKHINCKGLKYTRILSIVPMKQNQFDLLHYYITQVRILNFKGVMFWPNKKTVTLFIRKHWSKYYLYTYAKTKTLNLNLNLVLLNTLLLYQNYKDNL